MIDNIKKAIKMIREQPEEYLYYFDPFYPKAKYINLNEKAKDYSCMPMGDPQWVWWAELFNKTKISYFICKRFNKPSL